MVFQSYALYPHKTVRENLSFGLRMHKIPKAQADARVDEIADLLALTDLLDRKPAQLSGGQRQRVAMGRALAREPKAFLLDEPLSNLDAQLRTSLRAELKAIHQRFPTTSLYVTHDQVEAMTLGDRIAVMNAGRLLQLDTPDEIYRRPNSLFVAAFIGSPPMNLVFGTASDGAVRIDETSVPADIHVGGEVVLGVRPEALHLDGDDGGPSIPARVDLVEALGHEVIVHASIPGRNWSAAQEELTGLAPLEAERAVIVIRMPAPRTVAVGETVPLRFSPQDVHVFDPASGEALVP
jgi:ABC-type sugar transport system ATPase subunit